jgi:energy-coupling factor transporter ATP-binding protein EcfA2
VPAVSVDHLTKSYQGTEAVRDVAFEVNEGEVFALLGPNGAGKTSIIEILEVGRTPVERPWERTAWEGVVTPTDAEMDVADAAITAVRGRIGSCPTYGRVDIIAGPTGTPTVLEIELIDPYLSLDMVPAAATRMARTVLSV